MAHTHTQLQLHDPLGFCYFSIVNLCANYMHFYAAKSACVDARLATGDAQSAHSETGIVLATIW